ncbi:hypothetical protein [Paraburkholderia sp. MM5384-R2]|uniref:hypothetical protein n=1 Tax=Paraburkholderia sp. MM5384-R2 TaxID=2723097 RepID=UPI0016089F1C|nr:hypothetical protein [Paraburkholderia sp. MM5384-R2]MBB5498137.1 hypothetical protein [Paraburkholderia sp. MM5384-R2]
MAIDFKVGNHRSCTLHTRQEYRGNVFSDEVGTGRRLIISASSWELTHNTRQLAQLAEFMRNSPGRAYASGAAPEQIARTLQTAVERGDVIAVAPSLRTSRGGSAPIQQQIRSYYPTITPSQLVRGALPVVRAARSVERPKLPRLPAEDGLAIWYARPGDVLPDGTIATPVSTPLGNERPFEYTEDPQFGDAQELAARGVSEVHEANCFAEYEFDLEQCNFVRAMTQDPRAYAMCKQTAFQNYQSCRGF